MCFLNQFQWHCVFTILCTSSIVLSLITGMHILHNIVSQGAEHQKFKLNRLHTNSYKTFHINYFSFEPTCSLHDAAEEKWLQFQVYVPFSLVSAHNLKGSPNKIFELFAQSLHRSTCIISDFVQTMKSCTMVNWCGRPWVLRSMVLYICISSFKTPYRQKD